MLTFDLRLAAGGQELTGVHIRKLRGREAISELFRFELELACAADADLPEALCPNQDVSIIVSAGGLEVRRIHGTIARMESGLETKGAFHTYALELVPRVHRLALVASPSVYVDATVSDVIAAEVEQYDFQPPAQGRSHDYEVQLRETPARRELTVQYGESDFSFLARLTEGLGISFFFEHDASRDRIVFTDIGDRFRPCPGAEEAPYDDTGSSSGVYALREVRTVVPKFFHLRDHNYRRLVTEIVGEHELAIDDAAGGVVEHGCHARTPEEAVALARIRAEEQQSRSVQYRGESTLLGLTAGGRTTLRDHARLAPNGGFGLLIVEVTHEAELPTPWDSTTTASYRNEFVAVPGSVSFRPTRKMPRPRMPSVITGVIQPGPGGAVGGVAQLDDQGRYRVFMHFDLEPPDRPASSHPMRMVQPFGGPAHGMHFPLRRGTEVLIAFTNGDPDRPIILGALPNAAAPSVVTASEARFHRVRSPGGTVIEFGTTQANTTTTPPSQERSS